MSAGALFPGLSGSRYITRAKMLEVMQQLALDVLETEVGDKASQSDLTAHTGNTSNPHSVTKAQVGLGLADNTADLDKPISTAVQAALDDPVLGTVQALTGDGAASLTDLVTTLTTDAATQAVTLADGAAGQIKVVALAAQLDPADVATVTPATALGFTSFDLTAPGQSVTLIWAGGWIITSINGATIT